MSRTYDGKERQVASRMTPDVFPYGWVDLGAMMRPQEKICGYATTYVRDLRTKNGPRPFSVWFGAAGAIFSIPGCYGENCNGGPAPFGGDPGQGRMIDADHWESNADNEAWLHFPRQRSYNFDVPSWGGRTPVDIVPHLSANEFQNQPGANQVIGAGNIATMYGLRGNGFGITNDTCSDYFLRVYVTLPPFAPAPSGTTAPPPADAGTP